LRLAQTGVVAAVVLAALVAAAGCGSSSSAKTTTTSQDTASARTAWANSLCGALVTWRSDVKSVGTQLKSGQIRSKSALSNAAGQVESATKTLEDSLKGLGTPPTPAAQQAKSDIDHLTQQLSNGVDDLKTAASNVSGVQGVRSAIASAKTTVATMGSDVSATVTQLKSLDPQGAWKDAFSQASSCKTLSGS